MKPIKRGQIVTVKSICEDTYRYALGCYSVARQFKYIADDMYRLSDGIYGNNGIVVNVAPGRFEVILEKKTSDLKDDFRKLRIDGRLTIFQRGGHWWTGDQFELLED